VANSSSTKANVATAGQPLVQTPLVIAPAFTSRPTVQPLGFHGEVLEGLVRQSGYFKFLANVLAKEMTLSHISMAVSEQLSSPARRSLLAVRMIM